MENFQSPADFLKNSESDKFLKIHFKSPGFILGKIDPKIMQMLSDDVRKIESNFSAANKWNHNLAGQIQREYRLDASMPKFADYFTALGRQYNFQFFGSEGDGDLELADLWVNYQAKHEYNPPHNHKGQLSFVVWLQVPFTIAEEMAAINSKNTTNPCAANFAFIYNQIDGKIAMENLPVDRNFEGIICMFPAFLYHMVYPFTTSDNYRVSVAGNLDFKNKPR